MKWRNRPVLYEINTWVWLTDLRARYGQLLTLGDIPAREWDALATLHIDAVWFMGVWERSAASAGISNASPAQQDEFHHALPDYYSQDNIGSAYSIQNYRVAEFLGGPAGLARAREELAARGILLILDFVPNHVAPDHAWVTEHPEYFIRGTNDDLARAPQEFFDAGSLPNGKLLPDGQHHIIANGRDPHFAPWRDTAQLNAFDANLRTAALETVLNIAAQCDGMRCDVAMLLLNDIFARTWGELAGLPPATEYWSELIPQIKAKFPDVLFIAEAYWDLEYTLITQGFDYCYDKRLYDRVARDNAASVHTHLLARIDYQDHLMRFIENHDELRAAATLAPPKERAAAVIIATLPGAKLFHEGQFEGRKIRVPVFLARRAPEPRDYELESFYRKLLSAIDSDLFHAGEWRLCEPYGWSDNASFQNILAWSWQFGNQRALIVVNLANQRSQALVRLAWDDLGGRVWRLSDTLNGDLFLRDGNQLSQAGLYVDLDGYRFHFLNFE